MAKQTINIGTVPDDDSGDTIRNAFDKCNDNFTELYDGLGIVASLDDVGDVNAPTPAAGDVLTWDATPGEWVPQAPSGAGAFTLTDATDVDTTGQSSGDVLTYDGAEWVPQAPSGAGAFSGARISNSGAITPTTGAETDLTTPMDTEEFDTGGYFSAGSPGRLTVTNAGYYMVAAQTRRSASVTEQFNCTIRQYASGGSLVKQYYGSEVQSDGGDAAQCVTGAVHANAGDYFVLRYFVTNAGSFDAGLTWLSIAYLGS
jgi:hypothetical protein